MKICRPIAFIVALALCLGLVGSVPGASFNEPGINPSLSLIRSNNGAVRLTYRGPTNFQYILQASSNLVNWQNITTNVASNAMVFVDTAATNQPRRFYSAQALKTPMFYAGTITGNEGGQFLMVVRTNNVGTLFALNTSRNRGERTLNMTFDSEGRYCGPLFAQASGCLRIGDNNVLTGTYTNTLNQTGTLLGTNRFNYGLSRNVAGLYSANFAGAGVCPGTIHALVSGDGLIFFYVINSGGSYTDAAMGQVLGSNGAFGNPNPPPGSLHVSGTLNLSTATINGSYIHACPSRSGAGGVAMPRTERVF